ncbi:hypothetical protein ACG2LH_00935 [Zhouia sp. PK063]|uniref:hypothetical protein n=1 Tax=Zhouia sp. PK063 TaxID=3373602 RepID=UPI003795BA7F
MTKKKHKIKPIRNALQSTGNSQTLTTHFRNAIYILTILVFISACKQKQSKPEMVALTSKEKFGEEALNICKKQSENGIRFETCLKQYNLFTLKSSKGDTLYKNNNNPSEYILTDFNEDGYLDIELHFMTNVPGINELLIFDPKLKSFKEIENFSSFPAAVKIKGVDLFYSYHRSGCADSNWDSDLFYLKENKAVKIGNISGVGCTGDGETGIFISKVVDDKKQLIEKLLREPGYYEDKWDFIENYWSENYSKFE